MKTFYVDLAPYRNHRSIGDYREAERELPESVGISGTMILADSLPAAPLVPFGEIAFSFPYIPGVWQDDNCLCGGQELAVQPGRWDRAAFFGFAEWSDFNIEVTARYADGQEEICRAYFPHNEHGLSEPTMYQTVWKHDLNAGKTYRQAWRCRRQSGSEIRESNFFGIDCPLPRRDADLLSLKLPVNDLVHIYALTLCDSGFL